MYNHFIAKPKESYSDVDITKFTILGIFSVFATKGAVTTLFEKPIDLSASIHDIKQKYEEASGDAY